MNLRCLCLVVSVLACAAITGRTAPKSEYGKIELLRDRWGIPHVFSDTDEGATYGLRCATAEQRGLEMSYSLRSIPGRRAEVVGARFRVGGRETAPDHNRP